MINKRHWHHVWRYLRKVHPWYFLALTVVFGAISLLALRHNNEQMIQRRDAVYAADKDNGDVEAVLRDLRQYVYGHMNTSLSSGPNAVHPPIQLKYTYERLKAAQQTRLSQTNNTLYNAAQQSCANDSDANRVACVEQYMLSHGVAPAPVPDALYKFDFTSAKWSPDLAGWSLVVTVLSAALFLVTAIYRWWGKKYFA